MKIGIISALEKEIETLLENLEVLSITKSGGREFYRCLSGNSELVIAHSKCGKVSAAVTSMVLINVFNVDCIIFTGVAGSASEEVKIGDIVVANGLIQHDFDVSALTMASKYDNSLLGKSTFELTTIDVEYMQNASKRFLMNDFGNVVLENLKKKYNINNPIVHTGVIASGDQFIADAKVIEGLSKEIDSLKCVEMESAAVAQVCNDYNLRYLTFRIISDNANGNADYDFDNFLDEVATSYTTHIIEYLIRLLEEEYHENIN